MFIPMNRCKNSRGTRAVSALIGVAGAMLAAGLHANKDLTLSTPWVSVAVAGIAIAAVLVLLLRALRARDDQPAAAEPRETSEFSHHLVMVLVAILAGLLALGLFLALTPRAAASQEPIAAAPAVPQSAYVLTRGSDTIVVERVLRGRSSISGDITIRAQARMTFVAQTAPGPRVSELSFKVWASGASIRCPATTRPSRPRRRSAPPRPSLGRSRSRAAGRGRARSRSGRSVRCSPAGLPPSG